MGAISDYFRYSVLPFLTSRGNTHKRGLRVEEVQAKKKVGCIGRPCFVAGVLSSPSQVEPDQWLDKPTGCRCVGLMSSEKAF